MRKDDYYKKSDLKCTSQPLVNKEIKEQLSDSVSETLLQKKKERN